MKIKKQLLRKEISRKIDGNRKVLAIETVTNQYTEQDILTENELEQLIDLFDGEDSYMTGITFDSQSCLIVIPMFLKFLKSYMEDETQTYGEEDVEYACDVAERLNIIKDKLQKYPEYDLWIFLKKTKK